MGWFWVFLISVMIGYAIDGGLRNIEYVIEKGFRDIVKELRRINKEVKKN